MIKMFDLKPAALNKWLYQNNAFIIDFSEGCLLDNMLIETKRGIAAIYEKYINPNLSGYLVIFEPGAGNKVFNDWQARFLDHFAKEV